MIRPLVRGCTRVFIGIAVACAACGCQTTDTVDDRQAPTENPVPPVSEVVSGYNAGTIGLDRLWARVTAKISGLDAEGNVFDEQLEGHLQIERPGRLALTLGKLGDTLFYLGSNDERAWWFDLWSDPRDAVEVRFDAPGVGNSAEVAALLGLPVHPHDLVLLMGLVPLEASQVSSVAWAEDGGVLLERVRLSRGSASITLDPETFRPTRVVLVDEFAETIAEAELTRYGNVVVRGDATVRPQVSERVMIRLGDGSIGLRLTLWDPENKPIRDVVFDPDRLAAIYRLTPRTSAGVSSE